MTQQRARVLALGRLVAAASAVGVLAAATAIGVRGALHLGLSWLYGGNDVVAGLAALPPWQRLLAPAVGGVVAGGLTMLLLRRGSQGVADVMEAIALGRGRPRLGAAAAQAVGSIASALGGGSIGREGPLIQLGAAVGHEIATRATDSSRQRRALVAAGTAAGFAAAYNTPIAAVLFVLEVLVGIVSIDVIVPVAVATAIGTALTRVVVGGGPIYGARTFELVSSWEFVAFGVVGVLGALVAVGFMRLVGAGERAFGRLHRWPRFARAGLGGLLVGVIACWLPEVCGNGYEPLRHILDGKAAVGALLVLAAAKMLATTASVSSGSPGGVFTPTLLVGATLGAALGNAMAAVVPFGAAIAPGGYALVGMAAMIAATTHAPLMATVLVFELTGDYAIVLPLLLATAVATVLARTLAPDSIYTAELRRRGIPWEGSLTERLARAARARDIMEPEPLVVAADEPLDQVLARLAASRGRLAYVTDDGPLRAISLTQAKQLWAAQMRSAGSPITGTAGDVATAVDTIRPDATLLEIGEKLWHVDWGELPVVDPAAPQRPLGMVTRRALLGAFDRELLQREVLTTRVVSFGEGDVHVDYLELPDGHRVTVVPAPPWLVGRRPDLAALRAELGVLLVAVRRDAGGEARPRWFDADAPIELAAADRLMVIATEDELARLVQGPPGDDRGGPR